MYLKISGIARFLPWLRACVGASVNFQLSTWYNASVGCNLQPPDILCCHLSNMRGNLHLERSPSYPTPRKSRLLTQSLCWRSALGHNRR